MTRANFVYPGEGVGTVVFSAPNRLRVGDLNLPAPLREQVFEGLKRCPDGIGFVLDADVRRVHAFHLTDDVRDDLVEAVERIRSRRERAQQVLGEALQAGNGRQQGQFGGRRHVVLLVLDLPEAAS